MDSNDPEQQAVLRPKSLGPRARRRRTPVAPPRQVFETVETAAAKLGLDPDALRARCRRAAEQVGDAVVAQLGGGIVAFKFGKSWRIRFSAL